MQGTVDTVLLFIQDLAKRLVGRGTETVEQVTTRVGNAKAEINSLNEKGLYDYLIINDSIDEVGPYCVA